MTEHKAMTVLICWRWKCLACVAVNRSIISNNSLQTKSFSFTCSIRVQREWLDIVVDFIFTAYTVHVKCQKCKRAPNCIECTHIFCRVYPFSMYNYTYIQWNLCECRLWERTKIEKKKKKKRLPFCTLKTILFLCSAAAIYKTDFVCAFFSVFTYDIMMSHNEREKCVEEWRKNARERVRSVSILCMN